MSVPKHYSSDLKFKGLGLWYLKPLSTIVQLYRGGQFFGGGNRSILRKPTTCRKLLTLSHNVVSSTPRLGGTQTQRLWR
jgi:hypothetical protein